MVPTSTRTASGVLTSPPSSGGVPGPLAAVDVVRGHQAAVQEGGGDGHGLGHQAARVAAQVEQGAADSVVDRTAQVVGEALGEGVDLGIGEAVGEAPGGDRPGGQQGAAQADVPGGGAALEAEGHRRAGGAGAAQPRDDVSDRAAGDGGAVDGAQPVAGADPGAGGGAAGLYAADVHPAVVLAPHPQADAHVPAVERLLQTLVLLGAAAGRPAVTAAADEGLGGGRATLPSWMAAAISSVSAWTKEPADRAAGP
jgi:hypothetical protein